MATPSDTSQDGASDVEIQRRFNEFERRFNDLRRELLGVQIKLVRGWLATITILLALFGAGGYFGYGQFRDLESEAQGYVNTARRHANEIQELSNKVQSLSEEAQSRIETLTRKWTAETVQGNPDKAGKDAENVEDNPLASPVDQMIAAAVQLQRQGNFEGAIKKWRDIAKVVDGTDKELGAQAWFSVGYLHGKESRLQEAIDAFDKAIQLNPDLAEAYYNRGTVRNGLKLHEKAIVDFDETIRRNPDLAEAFNNRGIAKNRLGQHEKAIADFDKAIRLKPDYADAYVNRGILRNGLGRRDDAIADLNEAIRLKPNDAKAYYHRANAHFHLEHKDKARRDLNVALALARAAGDEATADKVRRDLERFFGEGGP